MPDYRITLTNRAKEDIIDIGDYITYTLLEPETAQNFIKGLRKSIATLNVETSGLKFNPFLTHFNKKLWDFIRSYTKPDFQKTP